ncbi:MAG: hypothetical protein IKJ52_07270 [Muribaculaceae bacterium]|nr:hypothetical protein [Muribaculaceae bacterium]
MRRYILIFALTLLPFCLYASEPNAIRSYGLTTVNSSMGPQGPPNLATYIEFYDNYILWGGYEKYEYSHTNYDGSIVYTPTFNSPPMLHIENVMFSSDYSQMVQNQSSSAMGMTLYIQYGYVFIGNGRQPASDWMSGKFG